MVNSTQIAADEGAHIILYTENLPPYNYVDNTGKIVGISTRQVRQVMDKTGLSYEIRIEPWARAKRHAETTANALLYSLVKTPERTPLFDWIVPLVAEPSFLYGLKSDKRIVTEERIRAGEFTAVCAADGRTCTFLSRIGFPVNSLLQITSTGQTLETFKIMASGRADLVAYTMTAVNNADFDTSNYEPRYQLPNITTFYLAASINIDVSTRNKIRQAYLDLQKEGFLQKPITPHLPARPKD